MWPVNLLELEPIDVRNAARAFDNGVQVVLADGAGDVSGQPWPLPVSRPWQSLTCRLSGTNITPIHFRNPRSVRCSGFSLSLLGQDHGQSTCLYATRLAEEAAAEGKTNEAVGSQ